MTHIACRLALMIVLCACFLASASVVRPLSRAHADICMGCCAGCYDRATR